jgi:hypothetical protein
MFAVDDLDALLGLLREHAVEVIGEMQYEDAYRLAYLMKAFEEKALGETSEMWNFWGTFREYLMTKKLHLSLHPAG